MGGLYAAIFPSKAGRWSLVLALALSLSSTLHAGETLTGKTNREKIAFLNTLIQTKAANLDAVLTSTFNTDPDPELVVCAGAVLIPTLKGEALKKAVEHVVEFPGPLPAFNLGRALAQQCAPDELGAQLATLALRPNWWEQRNVCILIGCAQDVRYIPTLLNLYNTSPSRIVKLEAIASFSGLKNPQAAKTLQNIYGVAKNDAEKSAVFHALVTCGSESDVSWILTQSSANGIESVIGAWAAAQLAKTLPKEVNALLKNAQSVYARRAGLLLMQKLATKEQWLEELKSAKMIQHPEVLEAIGSYFAKNPVPEAAKLFFDTADNCGAKDYRVCDAWCKAMGACAALGDEPVKDHAFKVLSQRVNEILGPAQHDARAKERRETSISAIYGLAALGTPAARNLLIQLALQSGDNVAAVYAVYEVLRDPDPSAAEKFRTQVIGMRDRGRDAFLRAAELLGCMSERSATEALFDFLPRAVDPASKTAVRDALSRATGHDFGPDPAPWQTWWKAENSFRFIENKFEAIKKGETAPRKKAEGSYDILCLNLLEARNDIPGSVTRFNGDEQTENAVTLGLRWLADHQDPDGKWNGVSFSDLSFGKKTADNAMKLGRQNIDISLTGLSTLAFLASNHTPIAEKSVYRETVKRALEWMASHQLNDGSLEEQTVVAKGGLNYFNYEQGIATLMFSEASAMTKDEALKSAAQRGLDKIFSSQTPGEGWRYVPRLWSDVSVVGWMVMAIKSGLMAGLEVDPRARISTLMWYEALCTTPKFTEDPNDVTDDYDKSVGLAYKDEEASGKYMVEEKEPRPKTSATAISGVCRIFLGFARSHPFCIGAANLLKKHLPQAKWHANADVGQLNVPIYYYYYGTIFMHQMGGDDWATWNGAMKPSLIGAQLKAPDPNAGAYPAKIGFDGDVGGQIYSTSMCVLTLETYYRYLPMLWFR